MKNTKKLKPISLYIVSALISFALLFLFIFTPVQTNAATIGFVDSYCLNVRSGPSTSYDVVGKIAYCNVVITGTAYDGAGDLWYQIDYNGQKCYVFGEYIIDIYEEAANEQADITFEDQLAQFPECYHSYLKSIHSTYPNYSFIPDYVNITFDDAVYQETLNHRKLVQPPGDGVSWRSIDPSAYNFAGGYWYSYAGGWADAAIDVIEYYMDPRNFLNTSNMYIFAKQTYSNTENADLVRKIVANTFMSGSYTDSTGTHSYAETILQAGKDSGVSAYVIAAILASEQGASAGALCNGSRGAYNFFNYGANGTTSADVINNGIAYAANRGWTTVYASIVGGANIYKSGYIDNGQDTYFYKDYNLMKLNFSHQYAQSVYDQISNGLFLATALKGDRGGYVTLRIPVYKTMPANPCPKPADNSNFSPRYNTSTGAVKARVGNDAIAMVAAGKPAQEETKVIETPTGSYDKGDVNGDGKITATDYILIKNHIMETTTITDSKALLSADANGDGKITASDYITIKNYIMNK